MPFLLEFFDPFLLAILTFTYCVTHLMLLISFQIPTLIVIIILSIAFDSHLIDFSVLIDVTAICHLVGSQSSPIHSVKEFRVIGYGHF